MFLAQSIHVPLDERERMALSAMAEQDSRYPKQQIAWLIREEARRRGLLDSTTHNGAGIRQDSPRAAVAA